MSAFDRYVETRDQIAAWREQTMMKVCQQRDGLLVVLHECEEFLDGQADVIDGDYGQPRPNRAMTLLSEVREAISKAERAS